ncbi:MAG: alcohol dehydrogenase, partial [Rhodospirillales bacterium]
MKTKITMAALLVLAVPGYAQAEFSQDQIDKGRYLAKAGNCLACHSAVGSTDFAGGLPMETPIGTVYSTNITPDVKTGIGAYTYADFSAAVRDGVAK